MIQITVKNLSTLVLLLLLFVIYYLFIINYYCIIYSNYCFVYFKKRFAFRAKSKSNLGIFTLIEIPFEHQTNKQTNDKDPH